VRARSLLFRRKPGKVEEKDFFENWPQLIRIS